jgi:hypothetical protein
MMQVFYYPYEFLYLSDKDDLSSIIITSFNFSADMVNGPNFTG